MNKKTPPGLNADELRFEIEATAQSELSRLQSLAGASDPKLIGLVVIGLTDGGALPMGIVGMDHAAAMQVLLGAAGAVEEAALEARLAQIRRARAAAA